MRSANNSRPASGVWTAREAYLMALVCLLIGLAIGYLARGSAAAPQNATTSTASGFAPSTPPAGLMGNPGSSPQMSKQMADQQAQPMLQQLRSSPNNAELLASLGNLYYDAQQYREAISYYERSLKIRPENPDVRTDLGTSYWYLGDPDKAIRLFEQSLTYNPKHLHTLFNMGIVKWQGKNDVNGAVTVWRQLQQIDPAYAAKAKVSDLIAKAQQARM